MEKPAVSDIAATIERLVPLSYAAEWDNVGLQVGDPTGPVERLGITLELSHSVLDEALSKNIDLILTHHPLIFKPLAQITPYRPTDLVYRAITEGVAVYSAHTNLDVLDIGPSGVWASIFNLRDCVPVEPVGDLLKLVVFVPRTQVERVRQSLGDVGAGHIGKYSHCAFYADGTGSFLPAETSDPYIGQRGELTEVEEVRLETVLPSALLGEVLSALYDAHPYEEPAFDLYPLKNTRTDVGMGRFGKLDQPTTIDGLLKTIENVMGLGPVRVAGEEDREIHSMAICGGKGEGLWQKAHQLGADVFLSGDMSYHEVFEMVRAGLVAIDLGHVGSEVPVVSAMKDLLKDRVPKACSVIELSSPPDPWHDRQKD